MASNLMTNDELRGLRVLGGKKGTSSIGKVRRMVFHPRERRVVGFIVKRPDLALMFHRKDLFVQLQGFDMVDGRVVLRQSPDATDKGACKALGIDYDSCVMWEGLPLMTESGETLGMVGTVTFDRETGAISTVLADAGATANTLLGKRVIPASLIKGFRRGIGVALSNGNDGAEQEDDEIEYGAILVSDAAKDIPAEGSCHCGCRQQGEHHREARRQQCGEEDHPSGWSGRARGGQARRGDQRRVLGLQRGVPQGGQS